MNYSPNFFVSSHNIFVFSYFLYGEHQRQRSSMCSHDEVMAEVGIENRNDMEGDEQQQQRRRVDTGHADDMSGDDDMEIHHESKKYRPNQ